MVSTCISNNLKSYLRNYKKKKSARGRIFLSESECFDLEGIECESYFSVFNGNVGRFSVKINVLDYFHIPLPLQYVFLNNYTLLKPKSQQNY